MGLCLKGLNGLYEDKAASSCDGFVRCGQSAQAQRDALIHPLPALADTVVPGFDTRLVAPKPTRAQRGQMAVELAVLVPVIVVTALIVLNLCRFVEVCAAFDRIAPDAVISHGVSPAGEQSALSSAGSVKACIEKALASSRCEVSVSVSGAEPVAVGRGLTFPVSPLLTTYTCTLSYHPWPGSFVIAGVSFSPPVTLRHVRTLVVDRYRPGVVV